MIPGGDHIHAGFKEIFGCIRGETRAAGSVFPVGNAQIDRLFQLQFRKLLPKNIPSRLAYNVSDYKYPQHAGPTFLFTIPNG